MQLPVQRRVGPPWGLEVQQGGSRVTEIQLSLATL